MASRSGKGRRPTGLFQAHLRNLGPERGGEDMGLLIDLEPG